MRGLKSDQARLAKGEGGGWPLGERNESRSEATAAAALNEFMLLVLLMFFMARHELRREIADSITGSYVNDGGLRRAASL